MMANEKVNEPHSIFIIASQGGFEQHLCMITSDNQALLLHCKLQTLKSAKMKRISSWKQHERCQRFEKISHKRGLVVNVQHVTQSCIRPIKQIVVENLVYGLPCFFVHSSAKVSSENCKLKRSDDYQQIIAVKTKKSVTAVMAKCPK